MVQPALAHSASLRFGSGSKLNVALGSRSSFASLEGFGVFDTSSFFPQHASRLFLDYRGSSFTGGTHSNPYIDVLSRLLLPQYHSCGFPNDLLMSSQSLRLHRPMIRQHHTKPYGLSTAVLIVLCFRVLVSIHCLQLRHRFQCIPCTLVTLHTSLVLCRTAGLCYSFPLPLRPAPSRLRRLAQPSLAVVWAATRVLPRTLHISFIISR